MEPDGDVHLWTCQLVPTTQYDMCIMEAIDIILGTYFRSGVQ